MTADAELRPEIVNPVAAEEIGGWARSMTTTFLNDPDAPATERRIRSLAARWQPERTWGARAGERWVASLRTESRSLTVPGTPGSTLELGVDALTNVTVAATHRRRGLMRAMLSRSLQAARERGDAASVLIAAEWPIYGRFGYAPATLSAEYQLDRRRPGAVCVGEPSRMRAVERAEFRELAPAVFDLARRRHAGQMNRDRHWWARELGGDGLEPLADELPHHWFVHDGDDGPDGLLAWRASGTPSLVPPRLTLNVWLLASANHIAYRDIWAYLTGIDLVDEVCLESRPVHEPARWLLADARTLQVVRQVDYLWLRLLDVPAALSARRYATPGTIVLEVVDEHAGGPAAGRYELVSDDEQATCTRTTAPADLRIDQRALASIYLGGFRLTELPPEATSEHTPGARARLDLMFSTPLPPWNATGF